MKGSTTIYLYIIELIGKFIGIPEIMLVACFASIIIFYIVTNQTLHNQKKNMQNKYESVT